MRGSRFASLLAIVAILLGLATTSACSGAPGAAADHNAADVAFVEEMLAHHGQAVEMMEMTSGRSLDPAFTTLVEQIRERQDPRVVDLQGWHERLTERSEADGGAPGSELDMPGMEMGGDLAEMMTTEQMQRLSQAPDSTFQRLWLQMMIEHHRGALAMAGTEVRDGVFAPAVELARSVQRDDATQISAMQSMLAPR